MYHQFLADGLCTTEHGRHFLKALWWLGLKEKGHIFTSSAVVSCCLSCINSKDLILSFTSTDATIIFNLKSTNNTSPSWRKTKVMRPKNSMNLYMYEHDVHYWPSIKSKLLDNGHVFLFVCFYGLRWNQGQ